MTSTLSGSRSLPFLETTYPNRMLQTIAKYTFSGFNEMPTSLHLWKHALSIFKCSSWDVCVLKSSMNTTIDLQRSLKKA